MADTFSTDIRSRVMRSVKSTKNKSTEQVLIRFFKQNKIKGWRRNSKIIGKPDFIFPQKRIIIFTDGCFWHGHDCRNTKPKANNEYWQSKIEKNQLRDRYVSKKLTDQGWDVIRLWECSLKDNSFLSSILKQNGRHLFPTVSLT